MIKVRSTVLLDRNIGGETGNLPLYIIYMPLNQIKATKGCSSRSLPPVLRIAPVKAPYICTVRYVHIVHRNIPDLPTNSNALTGRLDPQRPLVYTVSQPQKSPTGQAVNRQLKCSYIVLYGVRTCKSSILHTTVLIERQAKLEAH